MYAIRQLCENPFNGGQGMSIHDVMQLTKDQMLMLLCDIDNLKGSVGERTQKVAALEAGNVIRADDQGRITGRTIDGKEIKARIGGESLASQLAKRYEEDPGKESDVDDLDLPDRVKERLKADIRKRRKRDTRLRRK